MAACGRTGLAKINAPRNVCPFGRVPEDFLLRETGSGQPEKDESAGQQDRLPRRVIAAS